MPPEVINYFRNYLLDLAFVKSTTSLTVQAVTVTPDPALTYYRNYLGRI